jgi:hypothetical protein
LDLLKIQIGRLLGRGKGGYIKLFCCRLIVDYLSSLGMEMRENSMLYAPCEGSLSVAVPAEAVLNLLNIAPTTYYSAKGTISRLHLRWCLSGHEYCPEVHLLVKILLFSPELPFPRHISGLTQFGYDLMYRKGVAEVVHFLGLNAANYEGEGGVRAPTWHPRTRVLTSFRSSEARSPLD